jgi:hypothetical protein
MIIYIYIKNDTCHLFVGVDMAPNRTCQMF